MTHALDQMAAHRTVRRFRATAVPDADIRRAVAAAQCAATSSWIQGYSLLQVEDSRERAQLEELTGGQAQVREAGAFFVVSGDARRHRLIAERADAPRAVNLETFLLCVIDATLFAQNLALAFESMGYGTCFIGGLRTRLPEVDALLELPSDVYPLFGLCVGEPADDPGRRPRLPVEAVWMKGRYATDDDVLARIDEHDAVAARYYEDRGALGRNWSGGAWRKFQKPIREHLAGYYTEKGASLT